MFTVKGWDAPIVVIQVRRYYEIAKRLIADEVASINAMVNLYPKGNWIHLRGWG